MLSRVTSEHARCLVILFCAIRNFRSLYASLISTCALFSSNWPDLVMLPLQTKPPRQPKCSRAEKAIDSKAKAREHAEAAKDRKKHELRVAGPLGERFLPNDS